jgi:hypothetical protein
MSYVICLISYCSVKKERRPADAATTARKLKNVIIALTQQEILAQATLPIEQLAKPKKTAI